MMQQGSAHPGRARTVESDTLSILLDRLAKAQARRVLDIGCGSGQLAARLAAEGYDVTGIDPGAAAIAAARRKAPDCRFLVLAAENLQGNLGPFDAAVFLNALHHVPAPHMGAALRAALTTVRAGGEVVVIEPLAEGSFFHAMRPVDDESAVRAEAIQAIETLVENGGASLRDILRWKRENRFVGVEDFAADLLRVDPARRESLRLHRDALERAFRQNAEQHDGGGWRLVQPLLCWVLAAPD